MIESAASGISESSGTKTRVNLHVPADMAMYAALAGKEPQIDPSLNNPIKAAAAARRESPWSAMVLSNYLREICREKALKINRPELANWLKKQSAIAHKRLKETQKRLSAARTRRAA
jgi:hypothetical protein